MDRGVKAVRLLTSYGQSPASTVPPQRSHWGLAFVKRKAGLDQLLELFAQLGRCC